MELGQIQENTTVGLLSVLQCVAMCCSVLQCVAVRCNVFQCAANFRALQCVAVWCRVLQGVAVRCSALQYVAVCCSVLQCVAVCCSVCWRVRYSMRAQQQSFWVRWAVRCSVWAACGSMWKFVSCGVSGGAILSGHSR